MLRSGIFNVPVPYMAFIACLMTAFFAIRSKAIVQLFLATMLRSGIFNLHKLALYGTAFAE
jgi:hypothetical protein